MTSSNEKHFPRDWPFVRGVPRTKASDAELWHFLWSGPCINGWANNREAGDLRRHRAHYDVIVVNGSRLWIVQERKSFLIERNKTMSIFYGIYSSFSVVYGHIWASWRSQPKAIWELYLVSRAPFLDGFRNSWSKSYINSYYAMHKIWLFN